MLSLGKLAAGPAPGHYYEDAIGHGREDYYAGEGEQPGRWTGAGAEDLGLVGFVADGQIRLLLAGEHPATGELLGRRLTQGGVAGLDLTFKAPKSVSILFGIAEPRWLGCCTSATRWRSPTRSRSWSATRAVRAGVSTACSTSE